MSAMAILRRLEAFSRVDYLAHGHLARFFGAVDLYPAAWTRPTWTIGRRTPDVVRQPCPAFAAQGTNSAHRADGQFCREFGFATPPIMPEIDGR